MSMLIFIEDNKRNEHGGGEFSRKLKIFKILKFLLSLIWYSMHDLLLNHMSSSMIFPKPNEI